MDEKAAMIKELSDGIDLAKELRTRMLISSSDHDDHHQQPLFIHSLLDQMLSSFNKSISLASLLNSPPPPLVSRKRKKMADGIELVKVSPDDGLVSGLEGPLNDGFSWRKYGQKDILKAKYPRGYYRCSHRHSQGCAATKHVQRLDEDPSIYQVIYKGEHTCTTAAQYTQAHKKPNKTIYQQEVSSGLGPNVEPMGRENEAQSFNPFSLTEAQIELGLFDDYNLSSSPGFWSPPTLESDYLPAFPCSIAGYDLGLNVHTSESDVSESMSGLSSATNSPNVGHFEFTFDDESLPDIDVNFSFDCESLICKI